MEKDEKKVKRKINGIWKVIFIIFGCAAILLLFAFIYIRNVYKLEKIQVTGNEHYTEEEIISIVTNDKPVGNTIEFYIENKLNPVENITFIDKFEIEIVGKNTVTITVYEKSMAGCVMYMDQYIYFDDEGNVLETSPEKLPDIPCIEGLAFDSIVIGEKLPVNDAALFQEILTMTQLIEKNSLIIDEIRFDKEDEIVLKKDKIKIELGKGDNLEDKLMNLNNILQMLEGKSGTLDMTDYDARNGNTIFKENK